MFQQITQQIADIDDQLRRRIKHNDMTRHTLFTSVSLFIDKFRIKQHPNYIEGALLIILAYGHFILLRLSLLAVTRVGNTLFVTTLRFEVTLTYSSLEVWANLHLCSIHLPPTWLIWGWVFSDPSVVLFSSLSNADSRASFLLTNSCAFLSRDWINLFLLL